MKFSFALLSTMAVASSAAGVLKTVVGDLIPNHYIVVMHANTTDTMLSKHLDMHTPVGGVKHTYGTALKGFAAPLTEDELATHLDSHLVDYIEQDQMMSAFQTCTKQATDLWSLKRISTAVPDLSGEYHYGSTGEGVTAYVVDTGVRITHKEFEGRATFGFKAESSWSETDMNGHGTHVASTVGGLAYGVAKKAKIVAVKVLGDNGSGSNAGVIAGVDFVASDSRNANHNSVANMSLGGGKSTALNQATAGAISAGIKVFAVAAGNDNKDAKDYSPASTPTALTVGSSDMASKSNTQVDIRSYFSNFGPDLDIFAPGSDITGAWYTSDTATNTISGTSMASPAVCGVAALVAGANPSLTPAQVKAQIIGDATSAVVDLNCGSTGTCSQSTESLLYSSC